MEPQKHLRMAIRINPDGRSVTFIDSTECKPLHRNGKVTRRRASHVLPQLRPLRWLFQLLRWAFGEDNIIAHWTRLWPCRWIVDLSPSKGPQLGPFSTRQAAIEAEVRWLTQHVIKASV